MYVITTASSKPGNQKNAEMDASEKHDDDAIEKTPEDAVKEPLTPVPAIDDINPPLKATLGGDDLVIPLDKNNFIA